MTNAGSDSTSTGSTRRVAAVDCGTNSIRLLIAEADRAGGLVDLDRRVEIVRLGQGIDATGEFHPDALARTFVVVADYAKLIAAAGVPVGRIHFVATSAARDAGNRQEFFDGVRQRIGVAPEVITGEVEAQLSFHGALSRLATVAAPVLVMDIGGGSTELILGSADGVIHQSASLDIGSVRLTERFLGAGPPASGDLARASDYVDGLLTSLSPDLATVRTWIGVAGTVTTMAAVALGLDAYDRTRVHGSTMPNGQIDAMLSRFSSLTGEEIRAIPTMHPQRADVILAGVLIAARVAARVSVDAMIVSESDILDGIALGLLRQR